MADEATPLLKSEQTTISINASQEIEELRRLLREINEVTSRKEQVQKLLDSTVELNDVDQKPGKAKKEWTAQPYIILLWILIFLTAMCVPILIAESALLGLERAQPTEAPFAIFNLAAQSLAVVTLFYSACYARSPTLIRTAFILCGIITGIVSLWCYYAFGGVIQIVALAVPSFFIFVGAYLSERVYHWVSSMPEEDMTLSSWFLTWRLMIIIFANVWSFQASEGQSSSTSFFAVITFGTAMSVFCVSMRIRYALRPSSSGALEMLLQHLTRKQLMLNYGPLSCMLIVFGSLFAISGTDTAASDELIFAILFVFGFFCLCYAMVSIAFFSRSPTLAFINPFSEADYAMLDASRARAEEEARVQDGNTN